MTIGLVRSLLVFATVAGTAPARAGVVVEMTPDRIREAIVVGTTAKNAPLYEIRRRGLSLESGGLGVSRSRPILGHFTTPFVRIAHAAYEAKRLYKTFGEGNVSPEMLAPDLRVYGAAQAHGARVASVQSIVITPKGKRDPAAVIRPTTLVEVPLEFQNALGWRAPGKSLVATFPLTALSEGNEVHIIYDIGVSDAGRFCEDCSVDFKLDKVR